MTHCASHRMLPATLLFGVLLLSGCQTYHPKPLPTTPDLMRSPLLTVPVDELDLPGLQPHPIPTNGLDETAVVILAVLNNPDLKAARLQAGVAQAQLLEAGLLPDPVVSGGLAKSSMFTGYNVGLSEDIQALITRGAAKAAAQAHVQQINLGILWQEYQVAEKAEELFIQSRANDELKGILTSTHNLLAERYRQEKAALKQGNMTADKVSADLASLTDAETNLRQLQLDSNRTRHDLNMLLGLKPDVRLHLIGQIESRRLSKQQFQAAVMALPHRRADLLALQAGYQSQEQLLREAILAQFPSMSAGVENSKSPEDGIYSSGFTVNITLPLFNRNQGQIAIHKATRAQLYQTYQARLDQAASEVDQIWQAMPIMEQQLRDLEAHLPVLAKSAEAAEQSFQQGNLDLSTYLGVKLSWQPGQAEVIRLRAALERAQAALQMLLGLPLDTSPT